MVFGKRGVWPALLGLAIVAGCGAAGIIDRFVQPITVDGRPFDASCAVVDVIDQRAPSSSSVLSSFCTVDVDGQRVTCDTIPMLDVTDRPDRAAVTRACQGDVVRALLRGAREKRDKEDDYRPPPR